MLQGYVLMLIIIYYWHIYVYYIPTQAETGSAGAGGAEYAWHAGANRNFLPLKVKLSSEMKILEKE
jgi:hypothetical protein